MSVYVPTGACGLGDIFSVEVPEPTTELGLKLEEVRRGSPLTLKFTVPAKPPWPVIVTVYVVLEPRFTVALVGAAEVAMFDGTMTTSVTFAVCTRVPLVAVMVSV